MTLDVVETIRQLQYLGRTLSSDGKQLTVSDGRELSPELLDALRCHRDTLIRIFTPPPGNAERDAIQWAEQQPNPQADASLATLAAELSGKPSPFLTAAAKAFTGCRMRRLSDAEYDAIGFADSRGEQHDAPSEPRQPATRRGEWFALAKDIELRIKGVATLINAGEGVRRIATFEEIPDGFDLESMKRAAELYAPRGMVPVWVRGIHPAFLEPELLATVPPVSLAEASR